jgi:hypothetical protein
MTGSVSIAAGTGGAAAGSPTGSVSIAVGSAAAGAGAAGAETGAAGRSGRVNHIAHPFLPSLPRLTSSSAVTEYKEFCSNCRWLAACKDTSNSKACKGCGNRKAPPPSARTASRLLRYLTDADTFLIFLERFQT